MEQTCMKIGLKFPPEKTNKPIVTHLVGFGITFNILKAYVSPGKSGNLVLELTGTEEDIKRGIGFLEKEGVHYTVFTDSVIRYKDKCIHCGACTSICPSGALSMNRDTWELEFCMDECMMCGHCVQVCPARAIKSFDDDLF